MRKRNLLVSLGIVLVFNKIDAILEKRKIKKLEKELEESIIIIKLEV
jgi:50S ribosomal subunit-associated GTPase HflX